MAKPRSGGKRKPDWVRAAVLELHAVSGGSHRQLAAEFNRLHACSGMTVCGNTVRTWLRKYASEMETVCQWEPNNPHLWELDGLLHEFRFWYNEVRPHQHLHDHTRAEVWFGINLYRRVPRRVSGFVGWNGLLTGWYLHR